MVEAVAAVGPTMAEGSTLQAITVITKVVLVAPTKVGRTRTPRPTINTASTKTKSADRASVAKCVDVLVPCV